MSELDIEEWQKREVVLRQLLDSKTEAYVLLKPDAVKEGCVPMVLQILTENGFKIGKFESVNVTREDATLLYEADLNKTSDHDRKEELLAGVKNLVGECIIVSLFHEYKDGKTAWDRLSAVKGNARSSGVRTVRGKLCFPPPQGLSKEERLAWLAKTRLHSPWDEVEIRALGRLLVNKEII